MDAAAKAILVLAALVIFPVPRIVSIVFSAAALVWPPAAPWLRAMRRNARFRLRLYAASGTSRPAARIVCGAAIRTPTGVIVRDEKSSVAFDAPVASRALALFHQTNQADPLVSACALVVGSRVVDVLLIESRTLVAECPYISSLFLLRLYKRAVSAVR